MATQALSTGLAVLAERMAVRLQPKIPRSYQRFAEELVRMPPDGPHGGERFRIEWQPLLRPLWAEFDAGRWDTIVISGPAQSSKSFGGFAMPIIHDVAEQRIGPIVGVPEADMFSDKWDRDIKPIMEASEGLRGLLPDVGAGSRGGLAKDRVTLRNGINIKVMSRGGAATNKAGFTSPRLRITEAAGFSNSSTSDRDEEADTFRQMLARLGAFKRTDRRRQVSIEGTMTVKGDLPFRLRGSDDDEALISTRSRLVSPCPHCEAFISPEREHLFGWQDTASEVEAAEQAMFVCPLCGEGINDEQRRTSMMDCRLIHHGQELTAGGEVVGPLPPTKTLWFRWSAWHNLLRDAADVAVVEWQASQIDEGTTDRENAERDLCQKIWAVPYQSRLLASEPLSSKNVRRRTNDQLPYGILPEDTEFVVTSVDYGKWTGHWLALAFRADGGLHIPSYGMFDVMRDRNDDLAERIAQSLVEHDDGIVKAGFAVYKSSDFMAPALNGVDIGYMPDAVSAGIRLCGMEHWQSMRGRGDSVMQYGRKVGGYTHPTHVSKSIQDIGLRWFSEANAERGLNEVTFDSDFWTLHMQDRLRTTIDTNTALTLCRADTREQHARLSNHLTCDQIKQTWDASRGGLVEKWCKTSGDNHWGDCLKECLVLGNIVRIRRATLVVALPTNNLPQAAVTSTRPRW